MPFLLKKQKIKIETDKKLKFDLWLITSGETLAFAEKQLKGLNV